MIGMLSKLDIYGVGLSLRYNKEQFFQTKFGGIVTIIVIFILSMQMIFNVKDMVDKKNPVVIYSEEYSPDPERFDMKKDTYNFCVGVQYGGNYSHFIDESVYEIVVQQQIMKRVLNLRTNLYEQQYKWIDVPMKPCTNSSFTMPETQEYFQKLPGINNMYCLDDQNQELFIEGNYDQNESGIITIQFKKCTNKPYCKQPDEINQILTHAYVAFYSTDIIINSKKYEAFEKIGRDVFWNISPTVAKDAYVFYRNIYVHNNEGFFFTDVKIQRATVFSYQEEQVIFDENSYIFCIQLRNEKQKQTSIQRNYKKFDTLLAEMGGISKALVMVGWIICFPVNRLMLNEKLMNDLFNFQLNKDSPQKKKKQKESKGKIQDSKQLQYLYKNKKVKDNDKTNTQDKLKTQNQEKAVNSGEVQQTNHSNQKDLAPQICNSLQTQQQESQTKKVRILNNQFSLGESNGEENKPNSQDEANIKQSWYQYLRYYLWPWGGFKKLKKSIEKTVSQVHYHLDIIQLIRFQLEFEKIKQLLFDEDQIKLLQFLPKPTINLCEKKDESIDSKQASSVIQIEKNSIYYKKKQQSESQIKNEVEKALNSIVNKEHLTQIDMKLINMLNKQKVFQVQQFLISTPKYNRKYNFDNQSKAFKKIETSQYIESSCCVDINSENMSDQPNFLNFLQQSFPIKNTISQLQLKKSSSGKSELPLISNLLNVYNETEQQSQLKQNKSIDKQSQSILSISQQIDSPTSSIKQHFELEGKINKLPIFSKEDKTLNTNA